MARPLTRGAVLTQLTAGGDPVDHGLQGHIGADRRRENDGGYDDQGCHDPSPVG